MSSVLISLLSYLLLYKYITLAIAVFLAGVAIPLPIDTLLVATGAFSSQGYLSFTLALIVAVVANVLGDTLSYFIVRRYGRAVLREKYIRKYVYFLRLEKFVHDHAGPTIYLTRFVGILEILVNFISGYTQVQFDVFLFYDILGNFSSTFILLLFGYLLGNSWGNLLGTMSVIGTGLLVLGGIAVAFIIFKNNAKKETISKSKG